MEVFEIEKLLQEALAEREKAIKLRDKLKRDDLGEEERKQLERELDLAFERLKDFEVRMQKVLGRPMN